MKLFKKISASVGAILFPPRCVGCGELLHPCSPETIAFCPICRASWEAAVAEAAGQAHKDAGRGLVYLTFYHSGHTEGIPERLIYHLKHRGDSRAFGFAVWGLAPRILSAVKSLPTRMTEESEGRPILFTYPPRRGSAVRRDGYDHAQRLAKALAEACGGESATLIRRVRHADREQKELDAQARAENARRAYTLAPRAADVVRDRMVVICDDVYTTGATLNRCASLLVEAGAALVVLAAVERTHRPESRM